MNWDTVEGNWKQIKGKVKEQWGKLTDATTLFARTKNPGKTVLTQRVLVTPAVRASPATSKAMQRTVQLCFWVRRGELMGIVLYRRVFVRREQDRLMRPRYTATKTTHRTVRTR